MNLMIMILLLSISTISFSGDLDDGISVNAGFSSTNDDLKIKRNYEYTKMDIKAKIERAKYDDSVIVIDNCGGAGNLNVIGAGMNSTFINNSNNSGATSTCNKK